MIEKFSGISERITRAFFRKKYGLFWRLVVSKSTFVNKAMGSLGDLINLQSKDKNYITKKKINEEMNAL